MVCVDGCVMLFVDVEGFIPHSTRCSWLWPLVGAVTVTPLRLARWSGELLPEKGQHVDPQLVRPLLVVGIPVVS